MKLQKMAADRELREDPEKAFDRMANTLYRELIDVGCGLHAIAAEIDAENRRLSLQHFLAPLPVFAYLVTWPPWLPEPEPERIPETQASA